MRKLYYILIILTFGFKPAYGCSGFYIAKDGQIFAGNNEDFNYPLTKMWTVKATEGHYGRIYFGYDDFIPQGGINEKGLFFDGYATSRLVIHDTSDKPKYNNFFDDIRDEIMATCANVKEVKEFLNRYNLSGNGLFETGMLFFGDADGNSIIIDGGHIVPKSGSFQVVTNTHVWNAGYITDGRYRTATKLLEKMSHPTVDGCKNILDSVHLPITVYSQVYDIRKMKIYVYNFHNFNDCYVVDIQKALKKDNAYYNLPDLFKPSKSYENFKSQTLDKRYFTSFDARFNKAIGKSIDSNLLGTYHFISIKQPGEDSVDVKDTTHLITIGRDEKGVYLRENYAAFKQFRIYPQNADLYFYFARTYREDVIFKPRNELELLVQTYYPVYKWVLRLKKYKP